MDKMTVSITITIDLDKEYWGVDKDWIEFDVLRLSELNELKLYSEEVGDFVGKITKVENIKITE